MNPVAKFDPTDIKHRLEAAKFEAHPIRNALLSKKVLTIAACATALVVAGVAAGVFGLMMPCAGLCIWGGITGIAAIFTFINIRGDLSKVGNAAKRIQNTTQALLNLNEGTHLTHAQYEPHDSDVQIFDDYSYSVRKKLRNDPVLLRYRSGCLEGILSTFNRGKPVSLEEKDFLTSRSHRQSLQEIITIATTYVEDLKAYHASI